MHDLGMSEAKTQLTLREIEYLIKVVGVGSYTLAPAAAHLTVQAKGALAPLFGPVTEVELVSWERLCKTPWDKAQEWDEFYEVIHTTNRYDLYDSPFIKQRLRAMDDQGETARVFRRAFLGSWESLNATSRSTLYPVPEVHRRRGKRSRKDQDAFDAFMGSEGHHHLQEVCNIGSRAILGAIGYHLRFSLANDADAVNLLRGIEALTIQAFPLGRLINDPGHWYLLVA